MREYKKPGQFVTQHFDLDWRGYWFGSQVATQQPLALPPWGVQIVAEN